MSSKVELTRLHLLHDLSEAHCFVNAWNGEGQVLHHRTHSPTTAVLVSCSIVYLAESSGVKRAMAHIGRSSPAMNL